MNLFSEKKWQTFNIEQKYRIWLENFLYLERKLALGEEFDPLFFEQIKLLENETDSRLMLIFQLNDEKNIRVVYDQLRKIFNEELVAMKDFHFLPLNQANSNPRLPFIIIMDNLRSAFNVGSIIRTAECFNVEGVWFCGYTPQPTNPKVKNTAMGTEKMIEWKHFEQTADAINYAKESGYYVLAVETGEDAISIHDYDFKAKFAILMGNEALGIKNEIIQMCDKKITIPINGWKKSLNVATACAVVCCESSRKLEIRN